MEVEASPLSGSLTANDNRWNHLQTILTRSSPLAHPEFEPSEEVRVEFILHAFIRTTSQTLKFLQESCKLLVVGAGGLGCELLKDLVS